MKMLLLDVYNCNVSVVDAENLEDYYKFLNCNNIDIVVRRINNCPFEFICDDEGLLKVMPKISAINKDFEPELVGNLLIAKGVDKNGNLTPLSNEDVEFLRNFIYEFSTTNYPNPYPILTQMS